MRGTTTRSASPPTIAVYVARPSRSPSTSGTPKAPIPKNTPRSANPDSRPSGVMSATSALVAPLSRPPPQPNTSIAGASTRGDGARAIAARPSPTPSAPATRTGRYPNRSTTGPKTSDPARIPRLIRARSEPASAFSSPCCAINGGSTAPRVVRVTPKSSIPRQAAANARR